MRRSAATVLAAMRAFVPGPTAADSHVEEVVAFYPAAFEFPEGITLDKTGNIYVSMIALGQIRKIAPDGTQSVVATIPAPGFSIAGLEATPRGDLYAAVPAANPAVGRP